MNRLVIIALLCSATQLHAFGNLIVKKALKLAAPVHAPPAMPKMSEEVTVDLRNPKYRDGILYTDEGGVIAGEGLRIQARSMQYKKQKEITAEGDILVQFMGRAYVGRQFEFDLVSRTGTLYGAKTYSPPFYVGGDKITIMADGDYRVENAFITTCENQDCTWDIRAGRLNIVKDELLEAKQVRFRLLKFPLWLPSFRFNLKKTKQSLLTYQVTWDKGAGPRATVRYQALAWRNFFAFLRGEYRWGMGFGGALETKYYSPGKRTIFLTSSYLASDVIPTDPEKHRRYRLQGEFRTSSKSGNTTAVVTWDKFRDVLMPGDFKVEDFELNTALKTQLYVRHQQEDMIGSVYVRARANSFETIKQELPTVFGTVRPLKLGNSGIVAENWAKASYLDFDYSDDLGVHLRDFHAARLETHNELYWPLHFGNFMVSPNVGVVGIFYNNNPFHNTVGFGLIKYGGVAKCEFYRRFSSHKHVIQPYAQYDGYTRPTTPVDDHFIFSIQDGYNRQNLLRFGIRNSVFSYRKSRAGPTFYTDLYAYAFFAEKTLPVHVPWLYLTMQWRLPSVAFYSTNAWNFQHHRVHFANLRGEWTVNEDVALSLEVRYRSSYDWRKSDHENFFLDLTRSQEDLLASPLSDRRVTLLTHMFFRLTPFWSAHIQSHHGFARKHQTPYNEFKIDLYTWLSSSWRLRITYMHTERDDRVSAGIDLIRK